MIPRFSTLTLDMMLSLSICQFEGVLTPNCHVTFYIETIRIIHPNISISQFYSIRKLNS